MGKDLNIKPETIKCLEEIHKGKLHDFGFGSDFMDMVPEASATKAKLDKKYKYVCLCR